MPRIHIYEKDNTSPGTSGGYSNNTVLIAGFSNYTADEIRDNTGAVQADENGVFEFVSHEDFKKTIGLVAPTIHTTDVTEDHFEANLPVHYGNQMAYELLKMGYPVIYLNLGVPYATAEDAEEVTTAVEAMRKLGEDSTWEIFKDKASYDFRFVSHGLLTSSKLDKEALRPDDFAKSDDLVKLEARIVKMTELLHMFDADLIPRENAVEVVDPDTGEKVIDETTGKVTMRAETIEEAEARVFEEVCKAETAFVFSDAAKTKVKSAAKAIDYTTCLLCDMGLTYQGAEVYISEQEDLVEQRLTAELGDAFTAADFDSANKAIAKLAHYRTDASNEDKIDPESGRGDCVALVEVDESKYLIGAGRPENRIVNAINEMASIESSTGKYCACTVPSVVYKIPEMAEFDGNKKFPGAFHYLACFKNSLGLGFAEWYAAAGYTRGVSSYAVDFTTVKLGEIAIQALEPRSIEDQSTQPKFAVNVIANFRGSYYLWGNRTCHPLDEKDLVASHFLNIRQLCTTIKKQLYVSCRRFTFDPNSDVLWVNFKNSITPMLDRMKADQGVRDYKIEKVYTDKKATLKARIRIVPIEAVEDFIMEVSLEDSLGETAVTIEE